MVPMLTWGFVRSNFCLAIGSFLVLADSCTEGVFGSGGWTRTTDTAIMSRLLYL
jgi:hypothetical protein